MSSPSSPQPSTSSAPQSDEIAAVAAWIPQLELALSEVIVGQESLVQSLTLGLLTGGHILLEGVPGLAKSLAVSCMAQAVHAQFNRLQFTPDLLPSDLVGTEIYNANSGEFTVRKGPIFANFVLADEINRAPAKVQSALLEGMQEHQVSIGGTSFPLPSPFMVLATQNPIEQEGTYPLPEAQLDRFFFKIDVPFPTLEELVEIMDRTTGNAQFEAKAVLTPQELIELRRIVREVPIAPEVVRYAMRLTLGTHAASDHGTATARQFLRWGASPRGAQTLILGARVQALLAGRLHASLQDVRKVALPALRHRIGLNFDAEAEGLTPDALVERVLDEVPEVESRVARELRQ